LQKQLDKRWECEYELKEECGKPKNIVKEVKVSHV
jgi:hypothetical protein